MVASFTAGCGVLHWAGHQDGAAGCNGRATGELVRLLLSGTCPAHLTGPTHRSASCAAVLQVMEEQVQRADEAKAESLRRAEQDEVEVRQLKQSLKAASSEPEEPHPSTSLKEAPQLSPGAAKPHSKKGCVQPNSM